MAKKPPTAQKQHLAGDELSEQSKKIAHQVLDRVRTEIDYAMGQLSLALASANARVTNDGMTRCLDALERAQGELVREFKERTEELAKPLEAFSGAEPLSEKSSNEY